MPKQFLLEITTPERLFLTEMVELVILPTGDGENGVMAGHEKMVTSLVSGIIRIQNGDTWRSAACGGGYAMVYGERVVILVQSIEWPEEVDEARAEAAEQRAESRMLTVESDRDKTLTRMALERARTRLKLLHDKRKKN
jgi:F-type H+-transporting ATPase subunit epsilon